MADLTRIAELLRDLYGDEAPRVLDGIEALWRRYMPLLPDPERYRLSERDVVLITYADSVLREGERPLRTLRRFLESRVGDAVNSVHVLPFYPYSSDDGFSVIDYRAVDPEVGDWDDVQGLGTRYRLMFDLVANHASAQSEWFQAFRQGREPYRRYFVTVPPGTDLSSVFRPRALPLLTPVSTVEGEALVWTTFSADQVDLDYRTPEVLLEMLDVLLGYVALGARLIRLDAIAFIWKEVGTRCLHLPQAHRIVQLMRAVLDLAAPQVALITETNVPHEDNISYWGDGRHEAQMVYNFSLPPLALHALHTGCGERLSAWAAGLELPSEHTTFFNFTASHDGIGVTPARGYLSEEAVAALAERVVAVGGQVSYRHLPDGGQAPYELNSTYLDALADPARPEESSSLLAARFCLSQALMLALRGVPAVYYHSLLGSRNWQEGVRLTGRARTINREKLDSGLLEAELDQLGHLRAEVFSRMVRLLRARRAEPALHPHGGQRVLDLGPALFALLRTSPRGEWRAICLHNLTDQLQRAAVPLAGLAWPSGAGARDLLGATKASRGSREALSVSLQPYQAAWLVPQETDA